MTFFVNGRFLARPVTGVERFAHQILDEAHAAVANGGAESGRWHVLAPPGTPRPDKWPAFGFDTVGTRGGHVWEQTSFRRASRSGVAISLCNSGPVLHPRPVTVIHDALVYDLPENFSRPYRMAHRTLGRLFARRSRIATVSAFSRERLCAVLGLDPDEVGIVYNAADHVRALVPDMSVIERLDLGEAPYLLFVGSFAPNKNLQRTVDAFARLARPGVHLVLVGAKGATFARGALGELPSGVIVPGRVSDAELAALYGRAQALVFPSLYEGFGIPPLEAMEFGCPVVASTAPAVREVCGDAATYCDPLKVDEIAAAMARILDDPDMRTTLVARGREQARRYSWANSARALIDFVQVASGDSAK